MRLHTDKLAPEEIYAALREIPNQTAYHLIHIEDFAEHGSRKRSRAYEIGLATYYGGPGTKNPYRRNTGQYGAEGGDIWAATYDEWGYFIAALFAIDPDAIFGPYKGNADFHAQTRCAYDRSEVTA